MENLTETEQSRMKLTALLGLIGIAIMTMSQGATSPAIASFMEYWPAHAASAVLINSLPSLFNIPFSLLSGQLADRGILSYKQLACIGIVICTLSGLAPLLVMDNFALVLVARAIYGVGLGLFGPIITSVILLMVPGENARKYLAITSAFSSIGCIAFQTLGGFLCTISTRLTFAAHFICFISVILIFLFMPDPKRERKAKSDAKSSDKMGAKYLYWALCNMLFSMVFFVLTNNMATVVVGDSLGTSAQAGMALSVFTVGGFVGALISSAIFMKMGRWTLPVAAVLCALGYITLIFANSMFMIYAGAVIYGLGFGCWSPILMGYAGRSVPISRTSSALSVVACCGGLGSFLSSYIIGGISSALSDWNRFGFVVGVVVLAIVFVLQLVNVVGERMSRR